MTVKVKGKLLVKVIVKVKEILKVRGVQVNVKARVNAVVFVNVVLKVKGEDWSLGELQLFCSPNGKSNLQFERRISCGAFWEGGSSACECPPPPPALGQDGKI